MYQQNKLKQLKTYITNQDMQLYTNKTIFGFWLYIMSDCVLFASLFAMHITLHNSCHIATYTHTNIFKLNFIFIETFFLLLSAFTCSKSMMYVHTMNIKKIITWLLLTLMLGLCFISMEIYEFNHLIVNGYNLKYNAFFSSYFTLIGTHGIHVIAGLTWIITMITQLTVKGLTNTNIIRLQCLGLFWHFLDIIWICVFTEVYLIGVL